MIRLLLVLAALLCPVAAIAQPVTVIGPITAGNCTKFFSTTQISDAGVTCGAVSGITVGTTTIAGGTNGGVLYNNAGVLGNLTSIAWTFVSGTPTTVAGYGITNVRTSLTGATTYYVNGDNTNPQTCGTAGQFTGGSACRAGLDSGACLTPATACLTAQYVLTMILNSIDMAGQTTVINGAHCTGDTNCGRYFMVCVGPITGLADIKFTGDSTAPTAVKIIPPAGQNGISVKDQCTVDVTNIAFADNSTNNGGEFINVGLGNYGHVDVGTVAFGACTACPAAIEVTYSGSVTFTDSGSSSTGNKPIEWYVHDGGALDMGSNTFAGASSITYGTAFMEIVRGGIITGVGTSTFTGFASVAGPRCVIFGPYNTVLTNPNAIFPGSSNCIVIETTGAIGLQTGSGGSSSFNFGSAGHALLSGGSSSAVDIWDTAGVSCTLTTVSHLTVVNGIVTLCN